MTLVKTVCNENLILIDIYGGGFLNGLTFYIIYINRRMSINRRYNTTFELNELN